MKLGHRIIKHITLIALTSIVSISTSHGWWYYRAFEVKKRLGPRSQEVKNIESWVNTHQPNHNGLVVIPTVNTIHIWASHDETHKWKLKYTPLKQKKFHPEHITSQLNAGTIVPGGFLSGKKHRNRFVYFSTSKAIKEKEKWYYTHVSTKSKSWKTYLTDFIDVNGPRDIWGIRAALSNGRDFHLWVRKDNFGMYVYTLENTGGSMSNKHSKLNRLRLQIKSRNIMPIGFNRQSWLWYLNKIWRAHHKP